MRMLILPSARESWSLSVALSLSLPSPFFYLSLYISPSVSESRPISGSGCGLSLASVLLVCPPLPVCVLLSVSPLGAAPSIPGRSLGEGHVAA